MQISLTLFFKNIERALDTTDDIIIVGDMNEDLLKANVCNLKTFLSSTLLTLLFLNQQDNIFSKTPSLFTKTCLSFIKAY